MYFSSIITTPSLFIVIGHPRWGIVLKLAYTHFGSQAEHVLHRLPSDTVAILPVLDYPFTNVNPFKTVAL